MKYRVMQGTKEFAFGVNVEAESVQGAVDKFRREEREAMKADRFFIARDPLPVVKVYELVERKGWK